MKYSSSLFLTILLASVAVTVLGQTADDDEVNAAYSGYPHTFYSGNLIIKIHPTPVVIRYAFFPSLKDNTKDPLLLWLSGGPGCSSLLATFLQNGPFTFPPGSKNFEINKNTWNNRANLLYFEVPAGVGYSLGPEDEVIKDEDVVEDVILSLRLFFTRFPAYRKNDFYLSGHGYAAVYNVKLAKYIMEENNDPYVIYNDNFNLKGLLLGNPCISPQQCHGSGAQKQSYYHYEYLYFRGYFTTKVWNEFRGICTLNYDSEFCYGKRKEMDGYFNATNTSMYNIYDKCYRGKNETVDGKGYINTGCEDHAGIITYLNDEFVKTKWNIKSEKEWEPCNSKIIMEYQGDRNAYDHLPFLIKNHLRIWVYSGDLDSHVPIIGTKKWLQDLRHSLEMPVKRIWREWWIPGRHKGEDQVGGNIWELRDLTFVTVKAAGFRAAYSQPQAMTEVLNGFLDGNTLPYKNK